MTIVTVLAPDSSLAMDEVIRQLGDNAYILSTTHRDGQIEIRATNEPEEAKAAKITAVDETAFQTVMEHTVRPVFTHTPHKPKKPHTPLRSVDGGLSRTTLRPEEKTHQKKSDAPNGTTNLLRTAASQLSEVLETLNDALTRPEPQLSLLNKLGFSSELIANQTANTDPKTERDILRSLSRSLIARDPVETLQVPKILVLGPSGGGKTVLAGKIAALLRETQPNRSLSLGTLVVDQPLVPSPLAAYARVLGVEHKIYVSDKSDALTAFSESDCQIIEVNLDNDSLGRAIDRLQDKTQHREIQCVIALPTGSSPERISAELCKYKGLGATIALCKLDECELSPREISAIATSDVQIAWLSGTRSLTGNLAPATFQMMNEFLEGLVFGPVPETESKA